jgi:hypothetical protein
VPLDGSKWETKRKQQKTLQRFRQIDRTSRIGQEIIR